MVGRLLPSVWGNARTLLMHLQRVWGLCVTTPAQPASHAAPGSELELLLRPWVLTPTIAGSSRCSKPLLTARRRSPSAPACLCLRHPPIKSLLDDPQRHQPSPAQTRLPGRAPLAFLAPAGTEAPVTPQHPTPTWCACLGSAARQVPRCPAPAAAAFGGRQALPCRRERCGPAPSTPEPAPPHTPRRRISCLAGWWAPRPARCSWSCGRLRRRQLAVVCSPR